MPFLHNIGMYMNVVMLTYTFHSCARATVYVLYEFLFELNTKAEHQMNMPPNTRSLYLFAPI